MKKKFRIFKAAIAGILALSMLPLTGCHKPKRDDSTVNIAVIVKDMNSSYWDSVWKACDDLEVELGDSVNILRLGPDGESTEKQIPIIQDVINQKVDAIVLAACDPEAENKVLAEATAAGIPIITIDSDVTYAERVAYVGTMNKNAGESAARYAAELLGGEGTIGVIYHGAATTASKRRDGFLSQLESKGETAPAMPAGAGSKQNNSLHEETDAEGNTLETESETEPLSPYENIKIAKVVDGESDWEKSKKQAEKLITEDHVDLIFATNSKGTWGACEAISELGKTGEVYVVGFDYFEHDGKSAETYMSKGILSTTIIQNPYNMGYLGVRYAIEAANGETIPAQVDTGAILVTADNINDNDVQFLINN